MITLPDGTDIRTEPEEFTSTELKQDSAALSGLIPKLAVYQGKEFRELPEALQQQVRESPYAPTITAAGIERVYGILWKLTSAKQVIELLMRGESAARLLGSFFGVDVPEPGSVQTDSASPDTPLGNQSLLQGRSAENEPTMTVSTEPPTSSTPGAPIARSTPGVVPAGGGTLVVPSEFNQTESVDRPPTLRV